MEMEEARNLTRRAVSECLAIPAVLDAAKENLLRAAPRVLKQEHHDQGEGGGKLGKRQIRVSEGVKGARVLLCSRL